VTPSFVGNGMNMGLISSMAHKNAI